MLVDVQRAHLIAFNGASDVQLALILLGLGQQFSSGSFWFDTPLAAVLQERCQAFAEWIWDQTQGKAFGTLETFFCIYLKSTYDCPALYK